MLELNTIHLGNCLELMKQIDNESIDMILCDLPYGTTQNKWDSIIDLDLMWNQYKRIIKSNGAIVLTAAQPFTSRLILSNTWQYKYTWVWDKANPTGFLNAKKQPLRVTEDIVVFYDRQCVYNPEMEVRGKPRNKGSYNKPGGSDNYGTFHNVIAFNNEYYPTNLLRISNAHKGGKQHPTQKPVELFEYLIKTYTNESDLILDNCIGSGTTTIASLNTNRNFIGIELDPNYHKIATERVQQWHYNKAKQIILERRKQKELEPT